MPATSVAQQRLMGQAYAVKNGELDIKDVDPKYREDIQKLADGMTLQQLKDFAETKHKGLPDKVKKESVEVSENSPIATLSSVNGMGPLSLPVGDKPGSGDKLTPIPTKTTKKKKAFKDFRDFVEGKNLRSAF